MPVPVLAGIDLGTSSLKVVLLDDAGSVVATAASDYPILRGAPGEAEQDPEMWWLALCAALPRALAACGSRGSELRAIGVSGQMHGIVALDETMRPLRPAIIWADQRGAQEVAEIEQRIDQAALLAHTGSRASVGFSAPKILWLRRNEPDIFARCRWLLLPKDYLRLRLTGELATEPSDASATLLFDIHQRDWSDTLLKQLDLPRTVLPPIQPSLAQVGVVLPQAAAELGIPAGIPVIAGAGDTPAQALGYGVFDQKVVLATISSGGQLFATIEQPRTDPQGRIHTLCHVMPDRWYVLGALQAAGLALRWFRDTFARDLGAESYISLLSEAATAPAGANGLIFLPYLLGERTPHMDHTARAVFFGLTLQHDRAAATRAVLEGVAFAFRDALNVFREVGLQCDEVRMGGGGSRSHLWRGIFADVLGVPVVLNDAEQGAALGAALLAGLGIGHFANVAEATKLAVRVIDRHEPDAEHVARYDEAYLMYRALYTSLREQFRALAASGLTLA